VEKNEQTNNGANVAGYLFDDDIYGVGNMDEPTTTVLKASYPAKSKKPNNRKKR
jgi:hypothetical protein